MDIPKSLSSYNKTFQEDMHEWFHVESLTDSSLREDLQLQGLSTAVNYLHLLIQQELKLVPAGRLSLGGVSMGCAMALMASLCGKVRLGGSVGLCGWMPLEAYLRQNELKLSKSERFVKESLRSLGGKLQIQSPEDSNSLRHSSPDTLVFIGHSVDDGVVDVALGRSMCDMLRSLGLPVFLQGVQQSRPLG